MFAQLEPTFQDGALDAVIRNRLVESEPVTAQVRHIESHQFKADAFEASHT